MELDEIANLDEVKKALKDKYLKTQLGHIQAGHGTLDELKNQSDDDLKGSWVDWYSDPMFGGLSPDDFEEDSFDKDTVLKILNDKGTMPTKDEVIKYVSDNMNSNEGLDTTDADAINIADFDDEIKESGGDVDKIVDRIIDLSKTTDMSSDDIEYMRDVLTQKVKDYLSKKENTDVSSIAKSITQNDLGRSF